MSTASERIRERRELWLRLYREERAKLVSPWDNGRLTGRQIAYAKGRVTCRFREMGL